MHWRIIVFLAALLGARTAHLTIFWAVLAGFTAIGVIAFILNVIYRNGTGYIGAEAILNDDPLMLAAIDEAKRTWPEFLRIFRDRPGDAMVKYRLAVLSGDVENVWGDVIAFEPNGIRVNLRTPPFGELAPEVGPEMVVVNSDVIDWQVLMEDDTLRGGFTQRATFKII